MKFKSLVKASAEINCLIVGTELQSITLNPKQANNLTEKICCYFDIRPVPVTVSNELLFDRKQNQIFGQCVHYKTINIKKIFLYRDGNNVETLTHEIAHLKRYNHGVDFHQIWLDMMVYFKKNLMKSFVTKTKTIKTKKENISSMKKMFKDIIKELELEAVNKTLRIKVIGTVLCNVKMNNLETLTKVKKEMVKRGYRII